MKLVDVGGGTRKMLNEHDNRLFLFVIKGAYLFCRPAFHALIVLCMAKLGAWIIDRYLSKVFIFYDLRSKNFGIEFKAIHV